VSSAAAQARVATGAGTGGSAGASGPTPDAAAAALEVTSLGKRFGSFTALDDVSLTLAAGSVHALLGENGAGKSTLVKCVMGYHRPDSGRIVVGGHEVAIESPRRAQALGIGMVYQHFTLVPNMTVAENLVLARAALPWMVDWRAEAAKLRAFLAETPFHLPLEAPVRALAAGEKQKLEIVKQLYLRSRIVILDEPTSVLTPAEADEVLGLLRRLTREGGLSVLMITHKFREVMSFADEVTVLRRGRFAGRGKVADLEPTVMAEMMMGKGQGPGASKALAHGGVAAPASGTDQVPTRTVGEPRLRIDTLSAHDDLGALALHEISFDVCAGEIVGVAAIAGNGQEELVEVLGGQRPLAEGRVFVHGFEYEPRRAEITEHRVRCLPEEPLRNACVPGMSVAENLAFRDFDRPPFTSFRWGISRAALAKRARQHIADYGIRTRSPDTPIGDLSGGNVQRVVLARELEGDVQVLVVANPCMGLDFAATAEIHDRLRRARDRGTAILLVSADLDELLALSDRILVLSEGRLVHETTPLTADLAIIGQHMAGHGNHDVT
jgi:general nucleoside transport system ATP-binding protein